SGRALRLGPVPRNDCMHIRRASRGPFRRGNAMNETHESVLGHYRWVICALLFFATTVNYIDRQILSLLKPILDRELGWTNEQFGQVNAVFQGSYAIGLL